jgi:hypothetical protein
MALHHKEVSVKGFKNPVYPKQWISLTVIMMWNGREDDGNVRS